MATYGKSGEVRKMGLGAMAIRGVAIIGGGALLYATLLSPIMGRISGSNAPIEQGFVNYKSLKAEGVKNAAGYMEAIIQYKNGDNIDSLPCMKGYSGGVVCGNVDYLVENFTPAQREGVVIAQFQSISNDGKHGILSSEIQALLDMVYGTQNGTQKVPQTQYQQPKLK